LGTKAKVTNLKNGRSVDVRINDRGLVKGRDIDDVSQGATKIDITKSGIAPVKIEASYRQARHLHAAGVYRLQKKQHAIINKVGSQDSYSSRQKVKNSGAVVTNDQIIKRNPVDAGGHDGRDDETFRVRQGEMDALELRKRDHKKVRELFKRQRESETRSSRNNF
jgi:rare lipoprotein A